MLQEKAGTIAGVIYNALAEKPEGLTLKGLKKVTKLTEKDFLLGLGWLLREDKVYETETKDEKDPFTYILK
ncbi:MAG: winged helix-turn-helix domain-containing protein [Bacteroidaceae bacterium]|nr:winged helix-turn-helix domain-containing protein [Bacteroidaceae bacterium]